MSTPDLIYLAGQDAYRLILAEAAASPHYETGGMLVGRMVQTDEGLALVVVGATGPGPNAVRSPSYFEPDIEAHQRELDDWRQRYFAERVDYVGLWHTHRDGRSALSEGDKAQVKMILDDPSYKLPYGIYTPIITPGPGRIAFFSYFCPRTTYLPRLTRWRVFEEDPRALLQAVVAEEA